MSAHTPGPWTWGEGYNGLYGAGENVLTFVDYEGMYLSWSSKSQDANARLIAAAPDLLEALKGMTLAVSVFAAFRHEWPECWQQAVAAIKKAEEAE